MTQVRSPSEKHEDIIAEIRKKKQELRAQITELNQKSEQAQEELDQATDTEKYPEDEGKRAGKLAGLIALCKQVSTQ